MSRSFLTNINLNKNELQNAAIQALSTPPSSPTLGQIYYDTNEANLRQWDGTQWLSYVTSDGSGQFIHSVGDNLVVTDGDLTLGSKVVIDDASQSLTNKTLGTGTALSANLDANSNTVINIATPVNPGDAANKGYVDSTAQGLSVHGSVYAATNAPITYNDFIMLTSVDGVVLPPNVRVLAKNISDLPELNGIYIYNGTTAMELSTSPTDGITLGSYTFIENGSQAAQGWIFTLSGWTQFSAAGEYLAGTNISLADNTISVTGQIAVVNGGTGADNATDARANLGATTKVAVNNGSLTAVGGGVTWAISHNLGNKDVSVQVRNLSTDEIVEVDVVLTDLNTVTLSWVSGDVSADSFRAVIVG